MREIKFRGIIEDNDDYWIHGSLIEDKYIVGNVIVWEEEYFNTEFWWRVLPETVGQFTGLYDKNGKEVYEGDIVEGTMGKLLIFYGEIVGDGYGFQWKPLANSQWESFTGFIDEYEIIGNIHDNPELLERESD